MAVNLSMQKRLAAEVLGCGVTRVWIDPGSAEKVKSAITRADVKKLVKEGVIKKLPAKDSSGKAVAERIEKKKKGRRRGHGSRKGSRGARSGKKTPWILRVRAQRSLLKKLRDSGKLERKDYRKVYRMVKGGMFRSKKHLLMFLEQNGMVGVYEDSSQEKEGR